MYFTFFFFFLFFLHVFYLITLFFIFSQFVLDGSESSFSLLLGEVIWILCAAVKDTVLACIFTSFFLLPVGVGWLSESSYSLLLGEVTWISCTAVEEKLFYHVFYSFFFLLPVAVGWFAHIFHANQHKTPLRNVRPCMLFSWCSSAASGHVNVFKQHICYKAFSFRGVWSFYVHMSMDGSFCFRHVLCFFHVCLCSFQTKMYVRHVLLKSCSHLCSVSIVGFWVTSGQSRKSERL